MLHAEFKPFSPIFWYTEINGSIRPVEAFTLGEIRGDEILIKSYQGEHWVPITRCLNPLHDIEIYRAFKKKILRVLPFPDICHESCVEIVSDFSHVNPVFWEGQYRYSTYQVAEIYGATTDYIRSTRSQCERKKILGYDFVITVYGENGANLLKAFGMSHRAGQIGLWSPRGVLFLSTIVATWKKTKYAKAIYQALEHKKNLVLV